MKTLKSLIVFISLSFCSTGFAEGFVLDSLKEAQVLSKATNKPILLIVGSESCNYCLKLKNDLNSVLKNDIDDFIVCYLDIKSNPEIKNQFNISLIPDSRIINNDRVNSIIKGYKPNDYKKWLQNVK
jgi:thioredoxin-like negative regulator of GroEL